jgi:hypothetical protein
VRVRSRNRNKKGIAGDTNVCVWVEELRKRNEETWMEF